MFTDKRLEKSPLGATSPSTVALSDMHVVHTHLHGPHTLAHTQLHAHPLTHAHQHSNVLPHTHPGHHLQTHMTQHALQQMQHMQQQQTLQQQQHHLQHSQQTTVAGIAQQNQHQQQQQQHQQGQHHQTHSTQHSPVQQQHSSSMFTRFDANKSTKGASKLRRDLINAEIANLRDLLPLPQSTRQRLSQLQLMALVCVYVRKANYFQQVFKRHDIPVHAAPTPNVGFSKALSGFLMMLTQNGKLLYISDNAAEYLGHSMEDLLIHGDSVYDIIDKQDHAAIQAELNRNIPAQTGQQQHSAGNAATAAAQAAAAALSSLEGENRMFLCRMNVSRNARRQMRFGDQKVVLVQGHYLSYLPLCSRNEPVFLATCTPIAMPETRECVVQGATNVFTTIHSMDMKIAHIDRNGEFHLGYSKSEIQGVSWYNLLHNDNLREAQTKHRLITQSEQDRSCILLVRMQRCQGDFVWVHVVLQVRDSQDNQQPVIVCTNQVLNDREASVMLANSWLYHYYTVQSKIQFGLTFEGAARVPPTTPTPATVYYHSHHPHHHHHHHHHHPHHHGHHYAASSTAAAHPAAATFNSGYTTIHHAHHAHHPHHSHFHQMDTYGPYHADGLAAVPNQAANGHIISTNGLHRVYQPQLRSGGEPVDFSQVNDGATTSISPVSSSALTEADLRCSSANSTVSSNTATTVSYVGRATKSSNGKSGNSSSPHASQMSASPPAKKRAIGKLEPLYLNADYTVDETTTVSNDTPSYYDLNEQQSMGESRASVIFATVVPTRPRLLNKSMQNEPADFMDQWNPSPPWSESAQKLTLDSSSSSQQELSPCITMTPPTPTSAPPHNGINGIGAPSTNNANMHSTQSMPPAFSFEWMSDQLVPIVEQCVTCLTPEGIPMVMTAQSHATAQNHHHHPAHVVTHSHWAAAVPPSNPHQHISQHLATHGHRVLSISNMPPAHDLQNCNAAIPPPPQPPLPPPPATASAPTTAATKTEDTDSGEEKG